MVSLHYVDKAPSEVSAAGQFDTIYSITKLHNDDY